MGKGVIVDQSLKEQIDRMYLSKIPQSNPFELGILIGEVNCFEYVY